MLRMMGKEAHLIDQLFRGEKIEDSTRLNSSQPLVLNDILWENSLCQRRQIAPVIAFAVLAPGIVQTGNNYKDTGAGPPVPKRTITGRSRRLRHAAACNTPYIKRLFRFLLQSGHFKGRISGIHLWSRPNPPWRRSYNSNTLRKERSVPSCALAFLFPDRPATLLWCVHVNFQW